MEMCWKMSQSCEIRNKTQVYLNTGEVDFEFKNYLTMKYFRLGGSAQTSQWNQFESVIFPMNQKIFWKAARYSLISINVGYVFCIRPLSVAQYTSIKSQGGSDKSVYILNQDSWPNRGRHFRVFFVIPNRKVQWYLMRSSKCSEHNSTFSITSNTRLTI